MTQKGKLKGIFTTNIVAFLAAVLYGGGITLQSLFGWDFDFPLSS